MSDSHGHCDAFLPIIGILCVDIAQPLQNLHGNEVHSYLAASYVKYLETAGAKVIPIWNNSPRVYYEEIMNKINGILLPGGAIYFNKKYCKKELTNDSYSSAQHIYDIAVQLNRKGKYFPLWGTCLGFQLMLTHSAGVEDVRQDCQPMNCSRAIKFEDEKVLQQSKLFANISQDMREKMSQQPFGFHFHKYCITKQRLEMFKIAKLWRVLATNEDENGLEFISIVEHKEFPFFGAQFHPERVMFEHMGPQDHCHHCISCFKLNQYFARFFVDQCSKSDNRFANYDDELRHSIYNFPSIYTAPLKLHWQHCFLFKADVDYKSN
ncbi:gamma-glutamyl hydrolase A [Stomoxys calcitrans]|uniref:gamma-glutamyl hydrolase A n=1 Tax=Stomoxys calcitrans TaxID=35570 RepID=UPI0027E39593|nr:gamma-glutamyl hydrolase A [Stomoxys calcitrans]